jgi:orotate phosphoribosyltransferase
MEDYKKIVAKDYPDIMLRVIPGHFATANSHINYFIDMSLMKARQSEANCIAKAISERYVVSTMVDTILCMDGCEVIGAYLANHLTQAGVVSMNAHQTIYVTTPEFSHTGQLLFRENLQHMIKSKHVLLLMASVTTGKTASSAIDVINYYGGNIVGISSIFSASEKINGYPINALFTPADFPDYKTYESSDCAMCKAGIPIDAIANGFGYSRL